MFDTILIFTLVTLLAVFYRKLSKINGYWKERGLVYSRPLPLLGNMLQLALRRKSLGEVLMEICIKFRDNKVIGAYNFTAPVLLINDSSYAQVVLIKEFSSFMNRGPELKMSERRPLDKNLFGLTGVEWKAVRNHMSPVFTINKLRGMLPQIGKILRDTSLRYINENLQNEIELKSVVETFTMNVRASCVFGMKARLDRDSEFMTKVDAISNFNFFNFVSLTMALWFPKLAAKLNMSVFGPQNEKYFVDLLLKSFEERAESGSMNSDFIQTLLELKQTGSIKVNQWHTDDDFLKMDQTPITEKVEINDDILVAQSFIFLIAGLDTLRSTITMTLLELAKDRRVLEKLQAEVDQVMIKHGEMSHIALKDMEYLEMCIKESMRLYPPVELVTRHCIKTFVFENGVTVHPGTRLFIPVYRFHLNPEYFPDPHTYLPERFEEPPLPCSYLPFGEGPRICIAMRFAMMEMKMFISHLVRNYDFSVCPKTELPVKIDKWFFLRRPITPVYMKFDKRQH